MVEVDNTRVERRWDMTGKAVGAAAAIAATTMLLRNEAKIDAPSVAVMAPILLGMGVIIGGGVVSDIRLLKDDAARYVQAGKAELRGLRNKLRR
ncbi:MAG: hypothetical protein KGI06_05630 [Candidatus Micrarchaeota archaeon]|nr:hypothetical protein [Candidatus Micrarchaeota archaeon]